MNIERERRLMALTEKNSEIKPMDTKELQGRMITVYGGVKLSGREKLYLMLGPDFTVTETLGLSHFKKEV